MSDPSTFEVSLRQRAGDQCELCEAKDELGACAVPPAADSTERCALLCATCRGQLELDAPMDSKHWFCLQQSAWSEVAAVQVLAYRLLHRLAEESWARDLLDQLYVVDETLEWARAGLEAAKDDSDTSPKTVDSNGTELVEGDSVTLIKDLDVKGAGFTAKRGTLVKNIRLTGDADNVEGRVNKVAIVLKTKFLKKAV